MTQSGIVRVGPAWTPSGLHVFSGRFPLSVEAHLLSMTAKLLPGATTVTRNGRYYCLHGLVAVEAQRSGLDYGEAVELLRRCEVVLAATSHVANDAVTSSAHGKDKVGEHIVRAGTLDIDEMSTPRTGYSDSKKGFWGQYLGSEITLGILDPSDNHLPGPRSDSGALEGGLAGLLEAARESMLEISDLETLSHLGLNAAGTADGEWLLKQLTDPEIAVDQLAVTDAARTATCKILVEAVNEMPGCRFVDAFRDFVAFSDGAMENSTTAGLPETEAWRGAILRSYSVGAWRRLWKWLVDQLEGRTATTHELATECAALFPNVSLRQFAGDLPMLATAVGVPLPAEATIRAREQPLPVREVGVLVIGALRVDQLDHRAYDAFTGRLTALGPEWMARRYLDWADRPVAAFVADLVHQVVARSQRIAMKKSRLDPKTGKLRIPTRVYERDGLLIRTSSEGGGDVGLRIDELGGVMASVGAFTQIDDGWQLTDRGQSLR